MTAVSSSSSASAAGPDADAARQCSAASPSTELPQLDRQVTSTPADAALEDAVAGPGLLQPPGQAIEATDSMPQPASSVKPVKSATTEPAAVAEPAVVAGPAASQVAQAEAAPSSAAEGAGDAATEAPRENVQPAALVAVGKRLVKKVSSWQAVMNSSVAQPICCFWGWVSWEHKHDRGLGCHTASAASSRDAWPCSACSNAMYVNDISMELLQLFCPAAAARDVCLGQMILMKLFMHGIPGIAMLPTV